VRVVDNTPAAVCKKGVATYGTIQQAVDAAAPNDSVVVCPGTYAEQVTITTNGLKLRGNTTGTAKLVGPDIQTLDGDAAWSPALVHVAGARNVQVTKLVLDDSDDVADVQVGVQVDGGATGARIVNNRITNIRWSLALKQSQSLDGEEPYVAGDGIRFGGFSYDPSPGSGIASDNVITGSSHAGIVASGAGSVVNLTRNTIDAGTPTGDGRAGIDVSGGAKATLLANRIAGGFMGVALRGAASGSSATGNHAEGGFIGFYLDGQSGATLKTNVAQGGSFGIYSDTSNGHNVLQRNKALDNDQADCWDFSFGSGTGGTANTWTQNVGAISNPDEICG